jgi:hypothetical protein
MIIHVPDNIKQKYPNFEFRGRQKEVKGRIVIDAFNRATDQSFQYSFDEDFFLVC